MQNKFQLKMSFLTTGTIILSLFTLISFSSCRQKHGDPQKFSELSYDQLTEKNTPKGIIYRNGEVRLQDGYDIVHGSDSTMALIINPGGGGGGSTAMRCDCDGLIKIGCIVVLDGILTCKPLLCNTCKPVLKIYDGIISVDQFRK